MARIYLSPPHVGERDRARVLAAFDSGWIAPLGPDVDAFEREFAAALGVDHAAALSSGTAALQLALRLVGVAPGDEVITASLTFVATANAISYLQAVPVFLDSAPDSWCLDPALLEAELADCARRGRLPAAVVTVDIYGQCADYQRIRAACDRYHVPLVEDAAEALGASYRGRAAGTWGDIGVFSFNGNKMITTSGGGMLVSARADWVERARFLATQARDPAPHYQHSELGYNYRMSNLLAAMGRSQLEVLRERVARRRAIRDRYRRALGGIDGIELMPQAAGGEPAWWLTCVTVDGERAGASRDHIRAYLESCDIESRPVWKPMHLQPLYESCRVRGGAVSAGLFERGLCLPSGSVMTDDDVDRVVAAVRAALAETR
ncbi:MAG: aminotransferase class I/II-fold pyridoxal phosphate-dependent enzyme [Haliangiales bacterium]